MTKASRKCVLISFGRSKLLQSCSNFTLKPELKPTVTACLAGRDAQEALYTGFVRTLSSDSGADLGGGCRGCAPSPEMTCGFLIQLLFCEKKKLCGLLVLK